MEGSLGPYQLGARIAVGGMAEVFHARRVGPGGFEKPLVVKRLLPALAADPQFVAMFENEARLMARLSHPNLVTVFDFGQEGGHHYLAMEYVAGATLAQIIATCAPLPAPVAFHIAAELCSALGYIHSFELDGVPLAVVHRDVTPGNVFVTRTGAVKLGDFGVARTQGCPTMTTRGQLKGTLAYMSPEQARGEEVDARADIYAVGLVLCEMLSGRRLLQGTTESAVLSAALHPPPLDCLGWAQVVSEILEQALAPSRESRFSHAALLENRLRMELARTPVESSEIIALVARTAPEAGEPGTREAVLPARVGTGSMKPDGEGEHASSPLVASSSFDPPAPASRVTAVRPLRPSLPLRSLVVAASLGAGALALVLVLAWGLSRPESTSPRPPGSGPEVSPPGGGKAPAIVRSVPAPATSPAAAPPGDRPAPAAPATQSAALLAPRPAGARSAAPGSAPPAAPRWPRSPQPPIPREPAPVAATPASERAAPLPPRVAPDAVRRRRGLLVGDAPECDRLAQTGDDSERAADCYERLVIDRQFIEHKLKRVAATVAAAGRSNDPAVQEPARRVLELLLAGQYQAANQVLNEIRSKLR